MAVRLPTATDTVAVRLPDEADTVAVRLPDAAVRLPANFRRIFPGVVIWLWESGGADRRLPSRAEMCRRFDITTTCANSIMRWLVAAGCVTTVHGGSRAGTYAQVGLSDAIKVAQEALDGARKSA